VNIWITGASKGIGRALALEFKSDADHLFVSSRTSDDLPSGNGLIPIAFDAFSPHTIERAASEVSAKIASLDLLIANAGICEYQDSTDMTLDLTRRVMAVNYEATIALIIGALPLLRASAKLGNRPQLVVISSSITLLPLPRSSAYAASKAALEAFIQSLRYDLHNEGIDVTIVQPGFVDTPLTRLNDFAMPMLITAPEAAKRIRRGIIQRKHIVRFPKRFTTILGAIGLLPERLKVSLIRRISTVNTKKQELHK